MSFGNVSAARDATKIWAIGVQPDVEVVKYEPQKKKFVPLIKGLSATGSVLERREVDCVRQHSRRCFMACPCGWIPTIAVTSGADRSALPRWSPDGKQIAFVSMKPGESWKLWLVAADGGVAQAVMQENGSQIDANWSWDGSKLMFGDYSREARTGWNLDCSI